MRANEFVIEDISQLKKNVASQIDALPDTPPVEKTLSDIEDILKHVNAGGRMGIIKGELEKINDKKVDQSQKLLAKYIASIDMTPHEREEMFKMWREDKLVNRDKLLSGKMLPISELINGYDTNKGIHDLVDDLSEVSSLGIGKGEFLLSVLSKNINKMTKGDLKIGDKAVEVKTLDKGAGRFYDYDAKPTSKYSRNVEDWLEKYTKFLPKKPPATGVNLSGMVTAAQAADDKQAFKKDTATVIESLFPGEDASKLMDAVMSGDINSAKQLYTQLSLSYYIRLKKDKEALDGILYLNIFNKPITAMFFTSADDLAKEGLRMHADTIYPITDVTMNAYPQITIVPTKKGAASSGGISKGAAADQAAAEVPKVEPKSKPALRPEPEPREPEMRQLKK